MTQVRGPHLAWEPQAKANEPRLLITLGGTNSRPSDLMDLQNVASQMGYHVIGVDYPNQVITTRCRNSNDPLCFDKFRSEINLGVSSSPLVEVNSDSCIVRRTLALAAWSHEKPSIFWTLARTRRFWNRISSQGDSAIDSRPECHRVNDWG